MRIFLVGLPGVGKTFFGKQLAHLINYEHLDLDFEIEKKENKSISAIFNSEGEPYFRSLEKTVLETICTDKTNVVVSTGGGVLTHHNNLDYLKSKGITIYLKRPFSEIIKNIQKEADQRPMFKNLREAEIEHKIKSLWQLRRTNYEQTHIITGVEAFQKPQLLTNRIELFTKRGNSLIVINEIN